MTKHRKPVHLHTIKDNVDEEFVDIYSWIIGFIKGFAIGATYEFFHNNKEKINIQKVEEGFSYGYKESIWCCDLF